MLRLIIKAKSIIFNRLKPDPIIGQMNKYRKRFEKYSFKDTNCEDLSQFEACITKLYHSIEKGLSYPDYKPGFGRGNITALIDLLKRYIANGYDFNRHCYRQLFHA
jgi:hypothetical protein